MDYRAIATQIAQQEGVPVDLFLRMIGQESAWNAGAVSPKGASGLAQLMPGTARELGVDPSDPIQNMTGGARYLRQQLDTFGRPDLALAAYNAGPGAVKKHGGIPPYQETQNYVRKILGSNEGQAVSDATMAALGKQPTQGRASTQGAGPMMQEEQQPRGLLGTLGIQKMQEGAAGETGQRFYERDTFKDFMGNMAVAANTLRMNPDDNVAAQVQSGRDRRDSAKIQNKTVEWLSKQPGGETFAEMIRAGGSPAAVLQAYQQSTTATTKPTTDIQNYEYYRAQELSEGRTPLPIAQWSIMDEQATVPPGPDSGKFSEESAKFIVKDAGDLAAAGQTATRSLRQLDVLEGALANTPGGTITGVQSWLGGLGIATEGLEPIELANAMINQLVPAQRPPGSGTMSDADLALFKASLPRLMNTPGGNTAIISTMRNIANYDIQMGNISRQLLLQEINPRQAYDAYAAIPNPLADFKAVAGGGSPATAPTQGDIVDGYRFKGGNPALQSNWEAI